MRPLSYEHGSNRIPAIHQGFSTMYLCSLITSKSNIATPSHKTGEGLGCGRYYTLSRVILRVPVLNKVHCI